MQAATLLPRGSFKGRPTSRIMLIALAIGLTSTAYAQVRSPEYYPYAPPHGPQQQHASPYGQPQASPYGQQPFGSPHGQQQFGSPYGQQQFGTGLNPLDAPYTIQTRGPVHEAFAEPVLFEPAAGLTIPRRPPPLIDERPPEYYFAGDNVTWMPGYWGWDDDRRDFLWISGVWRNVPSNRQFVSGYWMPVATGHQWVPGFWAPVGVQTIQYLPPPPPLMQTGPMGVAPGPDFIWTPGIWHWQQASYVWRPGRWIAARPDHVWVPDHYVWAPSGYVFVQGYWDYALPQRGVLFAPAYMPGPLLAQPGFSYTPSVVVNVALLLGDLFARPQYRHYYFGDYYDRRYVQTGILPSFMFHERRHGYDPLFVGFLGRQTGPRSQVVQRFQREYLYLRDNPQVRPPRTFAALTQLAGRTDLDPRLSRRLGLAEPITRYQQRADLPIRRLQPDRLDTYRRSAVDTWQFQDRRRELETRQMRSAPAPDRPTSIDLLRGRDRQAQQPADSRFERTPTRTPRSMQDAAGPSIWRDQLPGDARQQSRERSLRDPEGSAGALDRGLQRDARELRTARPDNRAQARDLPERTPGAAVDRDAAGAVRPGRGTDDDDARQPRRQPRSIERRQIDAED